MCLVVFELTFNISTVLEYFVEKVWGSISRWCCAVNKKYTTNQSIWLESHLIFFNCLSFVYDGFYVEQNGGWCASAATARQTYRRYGGSSACKVDGEGGPWANQVYEIVALAKGKTRVAGVFFVSNTLRFQISNIGIEVLFKNLALITEGNQSLNCTVLLFERNPSAWRCRVLELQGAFFLDIIRSVITGL